MADITPLAFRGEGRTIGRISGIWGELLSEFFGTFILIAFGDGVVAVAVAGPAGVRPDGGTIALTIFNGRLLRLAADHLGLGDGRRLRGLGGRMA